MSGAEAMGRLARLAFTPSPETSSSNLCRWLRVLRARKLARDPAFKLSLEVSLHFCIWDEVQLLIQPLSAPAEC